MRYIAMLTLLVLALSGCQPATPQPPDYVPKPQDAHIGGDDGIDYANDTIAAAPARASNAWSPAAEP